MRRTGAFLIVLAAVAATHAQPVIVPNPGFEEGAPGRVAPAGWVLAGQGEWLAEGGASQRAIAATGNGDDTSYWRSEPLPLEPDGVYQVSFSARSVAGAGGTPITGPVFCNVDLGGIPEEWALYSSIFAAPHEVTDEVAWLRFGQWHRDGTVAFDNIQVTRVQPLYGRVGDLELGEGEEVAGNEYVFRAPIHTSSRNHSRPLARHQCGFNSYRLVFGAESELVYRHRLGDRQQLTADFDVNVGWYSGGQLEVSVSGDGAAWRAVGTQDTLGMVTYRVPQDLLPAEEVWVRFRSLAERELGPDSDPGSFQIHDYTYRATVSGAPLEGWGSTRFAAVQVADAEVPVRLLDLGETLPGRPDTVVLEVGNPTARSLTVRGAVVVARRGHPTSDAVERVVRVPAGGGEVRLPYEFEGTGDVQMAVVLDGEVKYQADVALHVPELYASHYGAVLPGSSDEVGLWWASSGWKIARERGLPSAPGEALLIRAARNEVEAAQLVLRPVRDLRQVRLEPRDLKGPGGARIPAEAVEVLRVAYVPVTRPTDPTGAVGLWPDPLPPVREALDLEAGVNQPFWVRVRVPRGVPAGVYRGEIRMRAEGYRATAPIAVEVYDFDLPERMTCQTAFGFSPRNVWWYHGLTEEADRRAVLDRYLVNYAAHHISPYDPAPLDPPEVVWPEVPADLAPGQVLTPRVDWTAWDRAMSRALDELRFNSFRLSIPGMGGGTFHARREPELLGYGEDTAAYGALFKGYVRAVQEHLRKRGWLDEAFVYWFDEPDPKDYEFVMNGFGKLAEAGPEIARMLTEQVEEGLIGGPNLWCPVSPNFQPEESEVRRAAGERFWWYVCTVPKAPYCTLFIDHPATELRVWLWQTWARGIDGILVWQTNYWTSGAAYPDHPQNPYEDPMGWVSGYSTAAGTRRAWGNGDGRFVYPPEAAAGVAEEPVLDGPVDSIRWEMLRDGIEDYEYLVMLRGLLGRYEGHLEAEQLAQFRGLLEVPEEITSSMTSFTRDPGPVEAQRDRVARAVAELARLSP